MDPYHNSKSENLRCCGWGFYKSCVVSRTQPIFLAWTLGLVTPFFETLGYCGLIWKFYHWLYYHRVRRGIALAPSWLLFKEKMRDMHLVFLSSIRIIPLIKSLNTSIRAMRLLHYTSILLCGFYGSSGTILNGWWEFGFEWSLMFL